MTRKNNVFVSLLHWGINLFVRLPLISLLIISVITAVLGYYFWDNFRINSEREGLISDQAEYRKDWEEFQSAFPVYKRSMILLIRADDDRTASDAAQKLYDELVTSGEFKSIFSPTAEPFFRDHSFLYMDLERLDRTLIDLSEAQPQFAALAQDPSVRGLFGLVERGVENYERSPSNAESLVNLLNEISDVGAAALAGDPGELDLEDTFTSESGPGYQIITLQINEDYSQVLSAGDTIRKIRDTADGLGLTEENGIQLQMTGSVPLSFEEMQIVRDSIGVAGITSLILLTIILGVGVRSLRIILSIIVTLFVGLVWTMAWAMWSVGELNTISISFAVLFVGLGVDFAIHLALRFQEVAEGGGYETDRIDFAITHVARAISLAAFTSAIGFLSFVPTEYKGIGDLGIIAGGGMAAALIASLTVLPALLSLMGVPRSRGAGDAFVRSSESVFNGVSRHAYALSIAAVAFAIVAGYISRDATFDFSTLTIKPKESEALEALSFLQEEGVATDYAIYLLAPDLESVPDMKEELLALDSVRSVETPQSLVPTDQDLKLAMIGEVASTYLPVLNAEPNETPVTTDVRLEAIASLEATLRDLEVGDAKLQEAGERLQKILERVLARELPLVDDFSERLTTNIQGPIDFVRTALFVNRVTFEELPDIVKVRLVSPDGQARLTALPENDITDFDVMKEFVEEVRAVYPRSTGRPVLEAGVGEIVVTSFQTAMTLALASIAIILLIFVRNIIDVVLILTPLLLAAALSVATGVLINLPFNQANIIVLPLIMGLGVDNGIHILMRFREDQSMSNLLRSSTPRAILLSTLTTIAAFGALSTSLHPGIQSMGILLTISMFYLLICTMIVLPALLYTRVRLTKGAPA